MMQQIRSATAEDIQAVFDLNAASFTEAWSWQGLSEAIQSGYDLYVWYAACETLAAYYLGQDVLDEVHIMQLAVAPAFRRQGLGIRLTQYILDKKRRAAMRHAWLEVRASNAAAQRLYAAAGFHVCGRRKNYYTPQSAGFPREDAMLMRYDLRERNKLGIIHKSSGWNL